MVSTPSFGRQRKKLNSVSIWRSILLVISLGSSGSCIQNHVPFIPLTLLMSSKLVFFISKMSFQTRPVENQPNYSSMLKSQGNFQQIWKRMVSTLTMTGLYIAKSPPCL